MAYPPGPERVAALPSYGANSAPTDRIHIVSAAAGFTAGVASDYYITPDNFLAEITRNITDVSLGFGDGVGATVSAAGKGKLRYNNTTKTFQVSEDTSAYQNLVQGSGANTQVTYWTGAASVAGSANLTWVSPILTVGLASSVTGQVTLAVSGSANTSSLQAGTAPAASLIYRLPNASPTANQVLSASAPSGGIVTTSWTSQIGPNAPNFSVQINGGGGLFDSNGQFTYDTATNTVLIGSLSALGSLKFRDTTAANGVTFKINAPSGNNVYTLPDALPTLNQFLQATAVSGVNVTLGWGTATAVVPGAPTTSVQFNNAGSFAGDAALTWVSPVLTVGTASTTTGQITFAVSGSANTQSFQAGTSPAASNTYRWPNASPTANQILSASAPSGGIVTLSWVTNVSPNAPNFSVQINGGGGNFDSNGQFTYDTATNTVIIGSSSALGSLKFRGTTTSNGVTFKVSMPSGNNVYTLPDALPTLNQVLTATAVSGVNVTLGWSTPASAATPGTPVNSVQFNQPLGTFAGDAGLLYIAGSTTGSQLALASSTITSGNLFSIAMTGTAAAGNTKTGLGITSSGANGTASQTVLGQTISVTNTGTTNTNIGFQSTASGAATQNLAGVFVGDVAYGGITSSFPILTNRTGTAQIETKVAGGGTVGRALIWALGIVGSGAIAGTYTGSIYLDGASAILHLGANAQLAWRSTNDAVAVSDDTGLARAASAVIRTSNGSTGIGSLLVAASTASVTGNFSVISSNAATAATYDVARLGANSSGTAATGFGGVFSFSLQSSTTADQQAAAQSWLWTTATHASRTAAMSWSLVNNATVAEYMRLAAPGPASATYLAIHAGTAPNVWTSGAFAAKLYLIDASGTPATGVAANFSATATAQPAWMMLRGRGTNASPAVLQTGDQIGEIQFAGMTSTGTNNFAYGAGILAVATETWGAGTTGTDMFFEVSTTGGTMTSKMSLRNTGTLRVGASSGTFSTTTLLQVGNYASWNTDVVAAFYTGANGTKGMEIVGTSGQTASLFRAFLDAGATLFNIFPSGAFSSTALTVATLPSAATVGAGGRAFVTDASTTIILGLGTTVTGGGANKVPVYSDGTNWIYG